MTTKYFVTGTNQEITPNKSVVLELGDSTITLYCDEESLEHLCKMGICRKEEIEDTHNETLIQHMTLTEYSEATRRRLKISEDAYIKLCETAPELILSAILKTIALDLDLKYKGHIRESEHIYSVSLTDGRLCEINKKKIKTFKNFAAFRTVEDGKFACRIVRPIIKALFKVESSEYEE